MLETAIATGFVIAVIALLKAFQALRELGRELYRIERVMKKIEEIK